jgi:hypothetical protein
MFNRTKNRAGDVASAFTGAAEDLSAVQRFRSAMSLMGQKWTNHRGPKSTFVRFGPKADKRGRNWIVR